MNKNKYRDLIEKTAANLSLEQKLKKVKLSGGNNTLLEINYVDRKKAKTKRLVEPYKLTADDFWGYDVEKDSIRRFKTKNIKGIKTTNTPFVPRWPIEI